MPPCPKCGIAVEAAWKFCPKCRARLEGDTSGEMCPSCGIPVKHDDRFCPNCRHQLGTRVGYDVPESSSPSNQAPQQTEPSIGERTLQISLERQRLNVKEREVDLGLKETQGYLKLYQDYKTGKQDLEIHAEEEKLRLERERIEALSGASLDVLISISGEEQSRLLADVAQVRALQGFSPQQILAKGAADNPEFSEAYKDLLMGLSANGDLDSYERLIGELKESSRLSREDYQRNLETMSEMFHKAVDSLKETSVALSGG